MNKTAFASCLGLLFAAVAFDVGFAQEAPKDHGAGALFAKRCASCHTVPDVRFATDRAWMDRILVTA